MSEAPHDDELVRQYLAKRSVPCPKCGYDLRGLTGTKCPECGLELRLSMLQPRPSRVEWMSGAAGLWVALVVNGVGAIYFGMIAHFPIAGFMISLSLSVFALVAWHTAAPVIVRARHRTQVLLTVLCWLFMILTLPIGCVKPWFDFMSM
ncbi:MAG: hypothetical protein SYC29_08750 [Planctomycetota bacterium]|nr:hypothetical protein [Planctomycetota bacterium]